MTVELSQYMLPKEKFPAIFKTNLSHDGLNPTRVPLVPVNNPTLCAFCDAMIGRVDILQFRIYI